MPPRVTTLDRRGVPTTGDLSSFAIPEEGRFRGGVAFRPLSGAAAESIYCADTDETESAALQRAKLLGNKRFPPGG